MAIIYDYNELVYILTNLQYSNIIINEPVNKISISTAKTMINGIKSSLYNARNIYNKKICDDIIYTPVMFNCNRLVTDIYIIIPKQNIQIIPARLNIINNIGQVY